MTATKFADLVANARAKGTQSHRDSLDECPYASPELAAAWQEGFDDAQRIAEGSVIPEADGIYDEISDHTYHSDRGSLSSTGAKTILEPGGPAKLRYAPRRESAAFDYGHAAHELVLGRGSGIAVVEADSWRTKAAKDEQADARAAGKTPLLRKDFDRAEALAEAILAHPLAAVLFAEGKPEQSIWATDEATGARIRCRPDWHIGANFVDLKTAADPGHFDKAIESYSYHLSASFYRHVARQVGIEVESFFFVAVGKVQPYLVDVCELSPKDLAIGQDLTEAAIGLWSQCLAADQWPGLPTAVRIATLPERVTYAAETAITRARQTAERITTA